MDDNDARMNKLFREYAMDKICLLTRQLAALELAMTQTNWDMFVEYGKQLDKLEEKFNVSNSGPTEEPAKDGKGGNEGPRD